MLRSDIRTRRTGAGSTIKVDAERAPLVRKGFELMATGNHNADDVLRTITALGFTNYTRRDAATADVARHAPQSSLCGLGEIG